MAAEIPTNMRTEAGAAAGDGSTRRTDTSARSGTTLAGSLPPTRDEVLRVSELAVSFPTDEGAVQAVRGIDYTVRPGEVLGIVGESGSGKSVSSMAIMGLLPRGARVSGQIHYRGRDLLRMREKEQRALRGDKIAMVFQDPMTSLNPVQTIGDQLAEAVLAHHLVSRKQARSRAREMLDLVGIPRPETRLKSYPHEFSGGMRQRVMIAMAIINDPDLIIADEPTTALDVTVQAQILEKLLEVKDAVDAAILMITHDLGVIAGMAHRVLVMYAGRAVELGEVGEVFTRPRMPYTAGLLGSLPTADAAGNTRLRPIVGTPPSLITVPPGCPFSPRCPLADASACVTVEPELDRTDRDEHHAACHHWARLAQVDDPTTFFRAEGGHA